jgi:hypothetical protein
VKPPNSPIPQYNPNTSRIAQVAGITKGKSDELYLLSYKHYKEKECEISYLQKNRGKETLTVLKKIGSSSRDTIDSVGIDKLPIDRSGKYSNLYNGLPEDFDVIYEHKVQGDSRLFYHKAGNIFYIICIKNNHIEVGKHRK